MENCQQWRNHHGIKDGDLLGIYKGEKILNKYSYWSLNTKNGRRIKIYRYQLRNDIGLRNEDLIIIGDREE